MSGLRLVLSVSNSGQRQTYDCHVTDFHGTLCETDHTEAPLESSRLAGVWSHLADMPTARSEAAASEVDGKIYVMGGFGAEAVANESYDIETNTWSIVALFPEGVDHAAAAAVGGQVYLIGGFNGRPAPESLLGACDPGSNRRSRRVDLPTAKSAVGAAVIEGKIYAVGGMGANGNTGALEVYDPALNSGRP